MRKIIILFILLNISNVYADSVFLKNGSITEGTIEKETSSIIRIKTENTVRDILKKDVIRTLSSDSYKKKLYIYKNDFSLIEGYLVDENRSQYVIRKDLLKNEETTLLKSDIQFYSRMNISACSGLKEGEYIAVETPYDWFYVDISMSYLINPLWVETRMTKLSFGISNSYSDWYHIGAHAVLTKFPGGDREPASIDSEVTKYDPVFFSGIITAGLNFIYNDWIGIQPFAGIGYNNGVQYSVGLSAPIRFSGYRWISVFVQYDRVTLNVYDDDFAINYPAKKNFNLIYAGIKFSL